MRTLNDCERQLSVRFLLTTKICFTFIVHFRGISNIIHNRYIFLSSQLINREHCWRYNRFKVIITDSKRQSLSHYIRKLDNTYLHIHRILIVFCRSIPIIYLHAICYLHSSRQLSALLSQDYQEHLCTHILRKRRLLFTNVRQSISLIKWIKPVYRTQEPRRRYWKAQKRVHSVVRAHHDHSCTPFLCHLPHRDFPLGHKYQLMGKYTSVCADSIRISAHSSIYDSYSSG